MKVKRVILYILICASIFINCGVYAKYEDSYDTDVTLNQIIDDSSDYNYYILWDDMKFTYTENKSFVYNETTHDYKLFVNEYWSDENNKISIKNNSFYTINVSLLYKSNDLYENVIGAFTPNNFDLKYNEKVESKLELNGKVNKNDNEFFTIGTITINIE